MTPKTQVRIPATRNIAPIPNPIAPSFFAAFFQLIWLGLGSTAHLVQVSPDTRKVGMHPSWPFSNSATFSRTRRPIRVRSFPKFKLGVCESKSFEFTRFESPVLEIHKLFSLPLMCPNDPKNATFFSFGPKRLEILTQSNFRFHIRNQQINSSGHDLFGEKLGIISSGRLVSTKSKVVLAGKKGHFLKDFGNFKNKATLAGNAENHLGLA